MNDHQALLNSFVTNVHGSMLCTTTIHRHLPGVLHVRTELALPENWTTGLYKVTEKHFIGLINLGVTEDNWAQRITQSLLPDINSLALNLDGSALATLSGVTSTLGSDRFYMA